jgi:hypothetical protein
MLVFVINLHLFGLAAGQCRANVTNNGSGARAVRTTFAGQQQQQQQQQQQHLLRVLCVSHTFSPFDKMRGAAVRWAQRSCGATTIV